MMTFFRNRMFLEGIAIGGICGVIIGSIIAFSIGENSIGAVRQAISKRIPVPGRGKVPYEFLA
jgi:hypothetical protein